MPYLGQNTCAGTLPSGRLHPQAPGDGHIPGSTMTPRILHLWLRTAVREPISRCPTIRRFSPSRGRTYSTGCEFVADGGHTIEAERSRWARTPFEITVTRSEEWLPEPREGTGQAPPDGAGVRVAACLAAIKEKTVDAAILAPAPG